MKCEGCGTVGKDEYKKIHLTNGGLVLCPQCLSEINSKNPSLHKAIDMIFRLLCSMNETYANQTTEQLHAYQDACALLETLLDETRRFR